MIAVRAWRRQLLGGIGAALIVPAALLGALALLVSAGGFAGLGALGQALAGPAPPAAARTPAPPAAARGTLSAASLVALVTRRAPSAPSAARAPATRARGGTPRVVPAAPPATRGGSSRPMAAPAVTGSPGGAPSPHPTLTDEVVGTATSATGQLPSPIGAAASTAIQSAGNAVDQVAPIPAPGPPQMP